MSLTDDLKAIAVFLSCDSSMPADEANRLAKVCEQLAAQPAQEPTAYYTTPASTEGASE
jgi:hypothetical protein